MDPRDRYRDKFGEAGSTAVPCTYFNNELIYSGKLEFPDVVKAYRLGSEIASFANALERFRLGHTAAFAVCFDIATDHGLIYCKNVTFLQVPMDVNHDGVYVYTSNCNLGQTAAVPAAVVICFNTDWHLFRSASRCWSSKRRVGECPASQSGGSQILISSRPAKGTRSKVGLQLATDNVLRRAVSVSYGCATVNDFIRGRSGNRVSSSQYGEPAAAFLYNCLTREVGEGWSIQPNVLLLKGRSTTCLTFECKRSGIIGGIQQFYTLFGNWPWPSSDLVHVPVAKEAMVNDYGDVPIAISKVNIRFENADECSRGFTSTVVAIITRLCCPQPLSYFNSEEENLVKFMETVLYCAVDPVLTLHEVKTVRKSNFKENTNLWPIFGNRSEIETNELVSESLFHCDVLTLHEVEAVRKSYFKENTNLWPIFSNRSEIGTNELVSESLFRCNVLTLHEVEAVRKSYFKENTNPWPTENLVNILSGVDNRSEIETSKLALESLLHCDDDRVLTLHKAKTARKSYFREQTNPNPNYVGVNQVENSTLKVGVSQNRMLNIDVIQQCVFNETMLLLLVKNQVLLRGGSLMFCARCLNPQAKTCKSHIISRCVLEQLFGNNTCICISQKEELVSSNKCWFRLLCRDCDNSTSVDENKFKRRFCAEELKVSPQKIPAVELRVVYAFFFRGIMANIDLLLLIARNQKWRRILMCVLRLREQCIKPRSAIKVVSCKLSNDSVPRSQSMEFPLLVSSEKWGSFFYLQLQQYCYAIPIEQHQLQDSLQANFPAIVKGVSSKLGQKREKYLRNFSKPINQALMVTGYVTGGQLLI